MRSSVHRPALASAAFHAAAAPHRHALRPQVSGGEAIGLETLCVRVGAQEYALPMGQVEGLLHHQEGMSVLAGSAELGRAPMLLLDLAELLGRAGAQPDGANAQPRAVVVLARGERRLGLVVDRVDGTLTLSAAQLRPAPVTDDFSGQHLLATALVNGRCLQLLSADTWFALADSPYVVQA
ncbi:MAG: hypothetical protein DI603_13635 [Roseateles depolymerans]|uniref:CheW-like domain-containing protein n=1 Tax=Roseateles depolymerans TaxID=76731 RepID=A0A2W5FN75_9BURK|nr:MAG: hypothetical protein DI603_13635 [Roseateles depolymerans]